MTSDESALTALSHAYADAARRGDGDAWGQLWVVDAVWELGPGRRMVGRDEIVAAWRTSMAKYTRVVQLYLSASFDIDGDRARGRLQLVELIEVVDGSRRMLAGQYDDEYIRTDAGWRYSRRSLTQYYAGAPDLGGVFVTPS